MGTRSALQRRLLTPGLPVLLAVRIAGSYLPADTETAAGGAWFDAVPLPDGPVALVVGVVCAADHLPPCVVDADASRYLATGSGGPLDT
ncbi:hypothetical protein [Amycolatopsis sp. FDAARGOS 1241]|uniref:hypothetical protein n=1 Tax=Amycolatopsis sp. FDAARGOS 1241 TaxID=2778070 RepID=UPI0019522085|nr:hypothetical protein [Amycolatopsis sp. FDAARGOS 1241]QRP49510.1 hypothetical protein I6J71_18175 [Amycolatopsis sp. FDAARGOS 1241]